ncbi:MAG: hypothetical protein E7361_03465 [Clostridiales bacterium]|nr:hypothetical protein [Clostridiales bacterium]
MWPLAYIIVSFIISIFIDPVILADGVRVNMLYVASIIMLISYSFIYIARRSFAFTIIFAVLVGVIYMFALQYNIFYSIDYNIYFSVALLAVPTIIIASNLHQLLFGVAIYTAIISICEGFFWYNELEYVELNVINLLNCAVVCFAIGTVVVGIRYLIRRSIRSRRESNI